MMHIARPAGRDVITVLHNESGTEVAVGITEQAAAFAKVIRHAGFGIDEITRLRQGACHFGLDAAIAGCFAVLLAIGAVVGRIPEAAAELHQGPGAALQLPGQRRGYAAMQNRFSAARRQAAGSQDDAVADSGHRFAAVEESPGELLQRLAFQVSQHAARTVATGKQQAVIVGDFKLVISQRRLECTVGFKRSIVGARRGIGTQHQPQQFDFPEQRYPAPGIQAFAGQHHWIGRGRFAVGCGEHHLVPA